MYGTLEERPSTARASPAKVLFMRGAARDNAPSFMPARMPARERMTTMSTQTRRNFLAHSAALTSVLAAASPLTFAQQSKKKLGWALCGLGGLSENQIAPALQKATLSKLAGVITDTQAKASKWKSKYG